MNGAISMADTTSGDVSTEPPDPAKGKGIDSTLGLWAGITFCVLYTVLIWALKPYMPKINFAADQGAFDYLWKLTDPTFWSRATAWTGYVLHQSLLWGLIYYAQSNKLKYSKGLHPVNIIALSGSAVFILLHLVQTQYFYDGLAQDVHIMSAQASVVFLLVMVIMMENRRRGMFFGKKAPFLETSADFLRKYHGYYFSWAVIWTFWYHPMETTQGHLLGTLYTCLIMIQGSLFFTRAHLNTWWTGFLEVMVLIHGTMVALMAANNGPWAQFFFGFLGMFIVTQMHGFGFSRWLKWAFGAAYITGVVIVYGGRNWTTMDELIRIPAVEFLLVFAVAGVIWAGMWAVGRLTGTDREKVSV